MKKNLVTLVILMTVILSVATILGATFSVSPTSLKFIRPTNQLSFTITPQTGSTASYSLTFPSLIQDDGAQISFSSTGNLVNINSPQTITLLSSVNYEKISVGKSYSGNVIVTNLADTKDNLTIPVTFTGSFCKYGEKGTDLEISQVKINNNDGDDEEWSPLDEITVDVKVSNDGDAKVQKVIVELGLYDSKGKNLMKNMDSLDKTKIDLGSIKDGDDDTATFTFNIPSDFSADNYKLVAKAYSDDSGEDNLCISHSSDLDFEYYQSISGVREEDEEKQIIFSNIKLTPSPAQCSETVQITGELLNIGDEDYENQVKVTLYNKDLNLNLEKIIRKDFDQGDSEVVDFEFQIPKIADEKMYVLEFRTYYDYDEDDDSYSLTSDQKFTTSLKVEGNCKKEVKSAQITAELDSETPEATAGKQVIIDANIKNTGDVQTVYTVSLSGNTQWSNVVSIDPQVVTLSPGDSKQVTIVLNINDGIVGDKEIILKTSYDSQSTEQKIVLTVSSQQQTTEQLGPFVEHLKANWFIYLIILVNVILIIAIILVIRSMVSPRPSL